MQSSFSKQSFNLNFAKNTLNHRLQQLKNNQASTSKTIAHIAMILVVVFIIALSNLDLAWGSISVVHPIKYNPSEPITTTAQEEDGFTLPTEFNINQNSVLFRSAVPRTIIPDRSLPQQQIESGQTIPATPQIQTYFVESGDTISGIAEKFNLRTETIIWSNLALENNPDLLYVGQELTILPIDGVYHQVGSGDTINGIAATFKVDTEAIITYPLNELDPENLLIQTGQWIIVPNGNKPFVPRTVTAYSGPVPNDATAGSGIFGWPASGSITNGYYGYHPGLDIGGWLGAPILAADSGYVVVAGWDNTGYGNMVVVDHGNGFQTVYAHLQAYYVETGTNVSKGQQIGEIGSTGNSTGPHLHFEIRQGTIQRNPYGFLP